MVSVGSLPVVGSHMFDLDTQNGVMHLLASIRASDISSDKKSDLRDLVFLYTNGGKDQSLRLVLEQKIAAYNIPALPTTSKSPAKPELQQPTIGKYRVAPSFKVSTAPAPVEFTHTPTVTVAEPAPAPHPVFAPVIEQQTAEQSEPVQPLPEVSVTPEPVVVSHGAPEAETPMVPVATTAHPIDDKQYLDRIREIKASVNEKVGNPVNLVDIDNEVGREYMGAILDAMKKLNSGSSAGSAMKRLEDAYQAVLRTLEQREVGAAAVASAAAEPAPVAPAEFSAPEPVVTPPPAPVAAYEPSPPVVVPQPQPVYQPIADVAPESPVLASKPVSVPVQAHYEPAVATPEPQAPYVPLSGSSKTGRLPIQDVTPVEPVSAWEQQPPVTHAESTKPFVPLSDVADKPLSIDDLPTADSLKSSATAGDPLFTTEVDEGLAQLLEEWSIFKKSGLFGTGPKGREHPLFKKMAPLHIPLILAGRFEGATQEIKQSVTDYMNGWRYEQGLIYQQGETFEHYLRRVIRHILDLQHRS